MSGAYYNEFDPDAAAWLEELIRQGHIAPGQVDTRSIEDVRPDDLRGFTQCHFFAGIGVWSYALRRAGWPDDRPVWTGSAPCQPFSAAGKGAAFDDERHLWPAFHHLIKVGRPPSLFGEQVASSVVDDWIDLVHADLEALGYAFGSVPFPSAGVGAPHIRDRNYWVAHAKGIRRADGPPVPGSSGSVLAAAEPQFRTGDRCAIGGVEYPGGARGTAGLSAAAGRHQRVSGITDDAGGELLGAGFGSEISGAGDGGVADASGIGLPQRAAPRSGYADQGNRHDDDSALVRPGPTNGYWADADWLGCRDGKWRPVEPGTFPLVDGAAGRVVRLRGYGNAINAEAAQAWIETVMECTA